MTNSRYYHPSLYIVNKKYKYKEIEFMKNPISEIAEKYYNFNIC